jgi:ribulose-phosphate 3-epimerase
MNMKLIAPSILSADFSRLGEEINAVEAAGADWIHIDVMDGHFVPNITMGPIIVEAAKKSTRLPLDVHLMIENPDNYIPAFAKAGADWISVQVETCVHLNRTIHLIKETGAKAGVVLNPATPVSAIEWVLSDVDYILVMSVNPGFGGQKFIENSLDRIRLIRSMIEKNTTASQNQHSTQPLIQIDGGVNSSTIARISEAGTDVFVAGSAIFGSTDYRETIEAFREKIG